MVLCKKIISKLYKFTYFKKSGKILYDKGDKICYMN